MGMIERAAVFLSHPNGQLLIAVAATLILYAVFRKREELSRIAITNTAATIMVTGANLLVGTYFVNEVNAFAQRAYAALDIPTVDPHLWDRVPFWLGMLLALAAKDFVDYWNHRLMHTRWVWPAHAAHHSDTHVNAFTTFRVHFLEGIVMSLSYILLLTWLQLPQLIPVVVVVSLMHNMYVHMDLDFGHGPLHYLIASPKFHRWHHADVPEAYGKNLANLIPLFDVIFGTYYVPGTCRAPMGARSGGIADTNPVAIYLYPVRQWAKLLRAALPAGGAVPADPPQGRQDAGGRLVLGRRLPAFRAFGQNREARGRG